MLCGYPCGQLCGDSTVPGLTGLYAACPSAAALLQPLLEVQGHTPPPLLYSGGQVSAPVVFCLQSSPRGLSGAVTWSRSLSA